MDAASARYAFVDVETTGFTPATCAVVEIGCLVVDHGRIVATFETLVNPLQPIPPRATAIHGIRDDDVARKPTLGMVAPIVRSVCSGAIVVAHNAAFDLAFLPFLQNSPSLCSYRLAARVVPEAPNHKNQTLRAFFKVCDPLLDGRSAHRALADVIVTKHVFFACLTRYLRAGFPADIGSLLAFASTRIARPPLNCHAELVEAPRRELPSCHAELVEAQRPSWRFGSMVSTTTAAN